MTSGATAREVVQMEARYRGLLEAAPDAFRQRLVAGLIGGFAYCRRDEFR